MKNPLEIADSEILQLVKAFNEVAPGAVSGPNCIDPDICLGDCCFIKIDIPKVLAEHYIQKGWAKPSDFKRGTTFSFVIDVNLNKLKCKFFDFNLNGCALHKTGMKTPQCWVYPTGFDPDDYKTDCKRAKGWKIIDPNKALAAQKILGQYVQLCKAEAGIENSSENIIKRIDKLNLSLNLGNSIPPYTITGVKDGWDSFEFDIQEGYSMGLKSLCFTNITLGNCSKEDQNFLSCDHICDDLINSIREFLKEKIPLYISTRGFKDSYSFIELNEL